MQPVSCRNTSLSLRQLEKDSLFVAAMSPSTRGVLWGGERAPAQNWSIEDGTVRAVCLRWALICPLCASVCSPRRRWRCTFCTVSPPPSLDRYSLVTTQESSMHQNRLVSVSSLCVCVCLWVRKWEAGDQQQSFLINIVCHCVIQCNMM